MSEINLHNDLFPETKLNLARESNEFFVTPKWAIMLFLNHFLIDNMINRDLKILDPCAGGCPNSPMQYPEVLREYDFSDITTNDIRKNSPASTHYDYLKKPFPGYDIIISNPPFTLSMEFYQKAISEINPDGYVIFMLQQQFIGSVGRMKILKKHLPMWNYQFSKRVWSCCREVAHVVWKKDVVPEFIKLKLI